MRILAIESSCDETAVAIVEDGRRILTDCIASQVALHREYGGVVPEIASRKHIEAIYGLAEQALENTGLTRGELDAVAVTYAPGLIGALLVGVNFAKAAALALDVPLIPVHHIKGHIAANYLAYPDLEPPFLCLVVSGGHTMFVDVEDYTKLRILGGTRDDAAGECFDKVARLLGMPYPGGAALDRAAQGGDPSRYPMPRPHLSGNPLDLSFSGLKTSAVNLIHNAGQKGEQIVIPDLCAAFSEAVCGMLVPRAMLALEQTGRKTLAVAGGVTTRQVLDACARAGLDKPRTPHKVQRIQKPEGPLPAKTRDQFRMSVSKPCIGVGYKEAPLGENRVRGEILCDLLGELVCGGMTPLYRRLYDEGLVNPGFGAEYLSVEGCCCILFTGESDEPEKVRTLLLEEIERIRREGVDEELFTLCKNQMYGEMLEALESPTGAAGALVSNYLRRSTLEEGVQLLAALTKQEVDAALQTMLLPEHSATVTILPQEAE